MDVTCRGSAFSGTIGEAKVFGYIPAILLNEYGQIQYVKLVQDDLDECPDIYWFTTHRNVLESNTGFTVEEQRNIERYLKHFGVLEISDDGEDEIKARLNNKVLEQIIWKPGFYLNEFKKAGII